jgi:hypothetical protein
MEMRVILSGTGRSKWKSRIKAARFRYRRKPIRNRRTSSNPQEGKLDIERIVAELKTERDRLSQAIAALEGHAPKAKMGRPAGSGQVNRAKRKRAGLTPEGRKRLSDMMKKRWAEVRKKGSRGHLYKRR